MLRQIQIACLVLAAWQSPAAEPASPARARVDYLRTVPSVREFTRPRSFFKRLINFVVGQPEGKPEIVRPYSTALDSTGRLLVADPGMRGVHIYDFEKQKYQFLKRANKQDLVSPIAVACDTNDDIYVSDSVLAIIAVFDSRGRFLRSIGGGQARRPTGMALDSTARRLYVADSLRHQILVLGLDGALLQSIGRRGTAPGEFNFPTALTLSAGKLYVVDAMNFRVQTLTTGGAFVSSFGRLGTESGDLNRPKGIAADSEGNLYIADALFETVQVFDPAGRLLYYFGSGGQKPGQFQLPSGIFVDGRNMIYVADSYNRRVQVFRLRRVAG